MPLNLNQILSRAAHHRCVVDQVRTDDEAERTGFNACSRACEIEESKED
jgi:hypothetical protein